MESIIGILELVVAQGAVHQYEGLKEGGSEDERIEHLALLQHYPFN